MSGTGPALIGTGVGVGPFVAAAVIAVVCAAGRHLFHFGLKHRRRALSIAAGVAVAYVFIDILPELAAHRLALVEELGHDILFAEQRIYIAALLGFVVFYGLDYMVFRAGADRHEEGGEPAMDHVFWLHVGGFCAYGWLIGYLLPERAGALPLVLYTVAMAFHFALIDHELEHEHGRAYDRVGRWLLAGSILIGCVVGATFHVSELTIARLFALVAGGVVITSAQAELPRDKDGRFGWFVLGAASYASLLLVASWRTE